MTMTERQVASKTFGRYMILHTIGKGEFGKVKLAYDPQKDLEVAIKFIKRSNITSAQKRAKLEREINILQNLNHPNIVHLYDVIETEKYIGIVMAYANGGELFEYISENQYLSEEESAKFFIQLLDGVQYLHSRHIVHRDLKLENLLLDQNGDIVITDFGFANNSRKNPSGLLSTSCGSPCYAAPELVINDNYVGEAADIWSCGIILYAMLCGYLPFDDDPNNPDGENLDLLYKYILESQLTFPEYVSEDAQELVCGMLIPDPEKRWPMEKVINHRWLRNSLYGREKMNESMNFEYMYDESYLKYINESSNSEIEKLQESKVPDYPSQANPQVTHSRQIGLDDETEHTEVYEARNNVSVSENVDSSIDKTEYVPSQELKEEPKVAPSVPSLQEIEKQQSISQSQTTSSQEYMDAQQELPVLTQEQDLMEVEEEVVATVDEDKMDIDEEPSPADVSPVLDTKDPEALEVERQNAEKQIEKLINEIQQEQFTQLEEMKDQLQEVVKDDIAEEVPVEEPIETEANVEAKKEESVIPAVPEVEATPVNEEKAAEVKEEIVNPETIEEKQEEITPEDSAEEIPDLVEEPVLEETKLDEEVAAPTTVETIVENIEEVIVPEVTTEQEVPNVETTVSEEVNEVKKDSPNTIKLDKEDLIEVDDEVISHSSSTSSAETEKSEEKVIVEVVKEEEKQEASMEIIPLEEAKAVNASADIEMKEQDTSKAEDVTTTMEEDEVSMLKKKSKVKSKKDKKKIKKRGKEIKKSKNKKNIKVKIKENKMFRTFFGCIMKD